MWRTILYICTMLCLVANDLPAADPPQAEISNGLIRAKFYLPDKENGYYRATRFDWSGIIYSLTCHGHEYFGKWLDQYDPKIHDAIMGPVEEFRTDDDYSGYQEAAIGATFIKYGVGMLRKIDEPAYNIRYTYEIVNYGDWAVRKGPDWIEFIHILTDTTGFGYVYQKTVRLPENQPVMIIEHAMKNTGKRIIDTSPYNHNFFMIDELPVGPDYTVKFPFNLKASDNLKGLAEVRDGLFVYLQELNKGQSAATHLSGFSDSVSDYNITIENSRANAGVKITCDRPLTQIYLWSIRTTVCPEPFVHLRIEPGQERHWEIRYTFYTLPGQ